MKTRKQISPMIKLLSITLCWHGTWYLIINEYQLAPTLCGGKHNTPFPSLPLTLVAKPIKEYSTTKTNTLSPPPL